MHQRTTHRLAAFAAAAALLLGACSSSGGDEASEETPDVTVTTVADNGDDTGDEEGPGTTVDDDGPTTTVDEGNGGDAPEITGDGRDYVEALAAEMKGDPEFPMTDQQADCFANRAVGTIGVDRIRAAGVSPADFADPGSDTALDFSTMGMSEADANRLYEDFGACDINIREVLLDAMAETSSPAAAACFEGALTEDLVRTLLISSFLHGGEMDPDDPAMGAVMGALMGCAFMDMDMG